MPALDDTTLTHYSTPMGLVFVFNLIVGTGALAMPKAFQDAGYVLGLISIVILALMSYISLTFVVEAMSASNALLESERAGKLKSLAIQYAENPSMHSGSPERSTAGSISPVGSQHTIPSLTRPQFFEIVQRVEFGRMASMFLNKWGVRFFYACLIIYLYGDLSIYATAVPKSMMNVVCTYRPEINGSSSCSSPANVSHDEPCWSNVAHIWTRFTVYRIFVAIFAISIGPWVFFNISKTKYLQTFSTASRWLAFLLMISLATTRLIRGKEEIGHPPIADIRHFGNLFGICVYAFMCHHSLPSVITPMKSKAHLFPLMSIVYVLILSFYITLSMTGSFAFPRVMDVYTLNFLHQCSNDHDDEPSSAHSVLLIFEYFLALFPVLTLSMTFPVVGITLRNNIQGLVFPKKAENEPDQSTLEGTLDPAESSDQNEESNALIPDQSIGNRLIKIAHNIGVPILVLVVPISVAMISDNVEILASITGSYAGVGVQYVMPSLLVWGARRKVPQILGESIPKEYSSPFRRSFWIYLLFVWAVVTVFVVTLNHIFAGV